MATKKSKSSKKSEKNSSTSKSAAKTVEKTELEAPKDEAVIEKKTEKKSENNKTEISEKAEKIEKLAATKCALAGAEVDFEVDENRFMKGFFAKKYEEKESIITIFKKRRFYGSLLGEVVGTMLISLLLFSLSLMGLANVAMYAFAVIAILIAVYAFSGSCLNPIVTVGMMATRRISVIRGIMYIVAEIIGAWLGWLIFNGFHLAGGDTAYDMVALSEIAEGGFWIVALVELLGAAIIGFFFARALAYRRRVFTFAAVVAGGIALAVLVGYVASAAFLGLSSNFIMNPAVALMMKIFPESGESFGEIMGGICQALSAYVLLPALGGVLGFWLSDFMIRLSAGKAVK